MHKVLTAVSTAAFVLGAGTTLHAQFATSAAAFDAIQSTPLGALPASLVAAKGGPAVSTQYGYLGMDGRNAVNTYGVNLELPYRTSRVGFTAAYASPECPAAASCDGHVMVGANWGRRLTSLALGSGADMARLNVGLDGALGFAKPTDASAMSAGIGMPISLAPAGKGARQVVPFLAPRFAWGRFRTDNGGDTGSALMLGGGVMVSGLTPSLAFNFGFQKLFIDQAPMQYGFGLTWQGR
jgi:hypothetical protein